MKSTVALVVELARVRERGTGVIHPLLSAVHPVIAAAHPLRSFAGDAEAVTSRPPRCP